MKRIVTILILLVFIGFGGLSCNKKIKKKSKAVPKVNTRTSLLSKKEVRQLNSGNYGSFYKSTFQNGYPGPQHVLKYQKLLRLGKVQVRRLKALQNKTKKKSIELGRKIVKLERQIDNDFRFRRVKKKSLEKKLYQLESLRTNLRMIVLNAHIDTNKLLAQKQVLLYNNLRLNNFKKIVAHK